MSSTPSLSLIISAYNEEEIIEDCMRICIDSLSKHFSDFELILIDDASTDRTGQLIDDFAAAHTDAIANIVVLHNETNLNMGASIQRGMKIACKDYVAFNAADLPFDPDKYMEVINRAPDADMIVAERIKYGGATTRRRLLSLINRAIMRLFFPLLKRNIRDTNYLQITRRSALLKIMPSAEGPIFTWPEMIFRAVYAKMTVTTIDAEYTPMKKRKGAFGSPRDITQTLRETLRFRLALWHCKVPR